MDKIERDLYVKFIKYYERYDREELLILRRKLIDRWNLIEESARNLIREEFKLELQAIDATLKDILLQEVVKDLEVEVSYWGKA